MRTITVIDYHCGNIGSVCRMLERIGCDCIVTSDPSSLSSAQCLLICGVGAFDHGIASLHDHGWTTPLHDAAFEARIPILGICLGMHLMCNRSQEGTAPGLGWINAEVTRFTPDPQNGIHVPHMGWKYVSPVRDNPLIDRADCSHRFYFCHSYFVTCHNESDVLMTAQHGLPFVAGFRRSNLWGLQFHPEKSHRFGKTLLHNFVASLDDHT